MPIQLVITGEHITDVFAEIQNFAAAIGNGEVVHTVQIGTAAAKPAAAPKAAPKAAPASDGKLTREEQDAAVEEMIEKGEKDDRFEQLTKGRQKTVEDGLIKKAASSDEETKQDDLDSMFDDDEPAAAEVTADMVREKMGALGKDAKGNPIQDNLVKIRDILTRYIPKGQEIKVGNIPAEKLAAAFAELEAMEG